MDKFTTSRGVEVEFLSIEILLDKVNASHPMPDPPTYSKVTAGKAVLTFPHDETTLEVEGDPEQTKKNRKEWAAYKEECDRVIGERNRAMLRTILLRGIKVEPKNDDWIHEHEVMLIKVPTDPVERRLHWIETEVMGGPEDYATVISEVMRASGVPEELLEQIGASFRSTMGRAKAQRSGVPPKQGVGALRKVRARAGRNSQRHPAKRV